MIEAHAHFNSPEGIVCVRVGGMDGKLYLDLCGADWRAVEIDAADWRVIDKPPVCFRRSAGMQPSPLPKSGGTVRTLKSFLNVKSDEDFLLVVKHMAAWLAPRPNADLLLERMWEVVRLQEAVVPSQNAVEIDGGDGSARSPAAVKAKQASAGKRA